MTTWQDIYISVDLIENTINQLEFLESIDKLKLVLNGDIIHKAIYRYEKWLGFYRKHRVAVYPPQDVLWIWHCHMLEPTEYYQDMMALVGELLDHTNLKQSDILLRQEKTKLLWESELKISFDYLDDNSVDESFNQSLRYRNMPSFSCNLYEASKKQIEFYYQVALPHYRSTRFLEIALERYKKFLFLKKRNFSAVLTPCYSIELMWRSHQLNPIAYLSDTTSLFGGLLDQEDSVASKSPGKRVDMAIKHTICLWKEYFDEEFFLAGSLYRGKRPSEEDYSTSQIPYEPFTSHISSFELKELSLKSVDEHAHKIFYELNLYQLKDSVKIPLMTNRLIENNIYIKDISHVKIINEGDVKLLLEMKYHEPDVKAKIKNVLKHGHRHDVSLDKTFQFQLKLPKKINTNETEEVKFYLENHKNEEYVLLFKWNVCANQRKVQFEIDKEEFKPVNMNEIKYNYTGFELNEIEFKNENALRVCHKAVVKSEETKIPLYEIEILHIMSLKWTSIRILQNDKMLSSAKLLDLKSLPSFKFAVGEGISLNLKTEKAMLVSNMNGDYALVKGKWIGFGRKSPGKLLVNIYYFANKTTNVFAIYRDFVFEFRNDYITARVDLKTGDIQFYLSLDWIDQSEIDSFLAIVFSIATIHVLLQPKVSISDYRLWSTSTLPLMIDKLAPVPIDTSHFLLNTIGFNELISSNSFKDFWDQGRQVDNELFFDNLKHSSWISSLDLRKESEELLKRNEGSRKSLSRSRSSSESSDEESKRETVWDEKAYNAVDESGNEYHRSVWPESYYSSKSYDISDDL